MADRFSVPALSCPFANAISFHADDIDRHVIEWACRFGLPRDDMELARISSTSVGRLAARTAPRANATALEFLADWQMWLFLFDDHYSDESTTGADLERLSQILTSFVRVLDGTATDLLERRPPEPANPLGGRTPAFIVALADLMRRLGLLATGPQAFRFVSAVRGYFLAQFWEAGHRASDRPAGLAEYQAMRRHGGAVPTCTALIDVADGFELATEDFCRPDVQAATAMAVNVTCWANDILSYPKEAQRSLKVHSLPAVLARDQQVPLPEAFRLAAAMHDREVERYLEAEQDLRRSASCELRGYLDGLRSWMGGNFYWSLETGRYNSAA